MVTNHTSSSPVSSQGILPQSPSAQSPSPQTAKIRLDFLDGLRGLAALFVVLHHTYGCNSGMNANPGLAGVFTNWLLYGHLSVDLFIVLSGFCLMMPVARAGHIKAGLLGFYSGRCRRILPPLYAAVVFSGTYFVAAQYMSSHQFVLPSKHVILANLLLLQDLRPSLNTLDVVAWSVAAEWKIYFLFPLFVWVWQRWAIPGLLATGAFLGAVAMLAVHHAAPHMDLTHTCPWYVFLFALGASGAAAVFSPKRSFSARSAAPVRLWPFICAALVTLALLLIRYPVTAQGEAPLYDPHLFLIDPVAGVLATLLLMTLARQIGGASRPLAVLSWRPLVSVGSFSYSIYLVHFVLVIAVSKIASHVAHHLGTHHLQTLFALVITLPLAVGAGYLFHLVFERPFMSKAGKPAPKMQRQAAPAALVNVAANAAL